MSVSVLHGDSRELLKTLADNSIDSVVCDPPYALVSIGKRFGADGAASAKAGKTGAYARASAGFMGKKWDTGETAFDPDFWAEIIRVLKPGGYCVAFGSSRTGHWLGCAMELGGFVMHPMLGWIFGSGFPKAHDAAKAIDKALGATPKTVGEKRAGLARKARAGGDLVGAASFEELRRAPVTEATTPEAKRWSGWAYGGQATKPALEPIFVGQKPFSEKNGALNILKWGTGALNIDACRIEGDKTPAPSGQFGGSRIGPEGHGGVLDGRSDHLGRWPANVIHDGSEDVLATFPRAPGQQRAVTGDERSHRTKNAYGDFGRSDGGMEPRADEGSAARFFYSAKAGPYDRFASKHPTVKPVELMRWLCRLVTPPGGVVLDPFAGSGTTGAAAIIEGFDCVLMEREAEYIADIGRRLAWMRGDGPLTEQVLAERAPQTCAGPLFDGEAA